MNGEVKEGARLNSVKSLKRYVICLESIGMALYFLISFEFFKIFIAF